MENYPKPVSIKCTQKILEQMENSICKILEKEGESKIGIFCKLKYKNNIVPVLITSYQIINERLKEGINNIEIIEKNELQLIEFGKRKYINKEYDLSIIEIKDNKNNKINYLEVDESINEYDSEIYYNKESIYILHYNNNLNDILVSYGIINNMNKDQLIFSCNIHSNYNCLPIFNLSNNKLIGLYNNKSNYYNKGIFLKFIINEFFNVHKSKKKNNEINLIVEVNKNKVGGEVYFLDNYYHVDDNNHIHHHENLKEINESNTELEINNRAYKFKKYFIPERSGIYNIKIKFNINLTNCSYMFSECENILDIDLNSFNTDYVTNMKAMFLKCTNIKAINLFSFNTKNVLDMSNMFQDCNK